MKEEAIPLNPIINTTNNNNNNISEPLLNYNYNNRNYLTDKNIILNVNINKIYKNPLVPTNVALFTFKGKPLKKIEDRIICCSRRRKMPKKISQLIGYLTTFSLFLSFTILMTICLCYSKDIPTMTESIKKSYNYLIFLIWFSTITSIISLTDAASSDPGRQRGTPIQRNKYDLGKVKKIVGGHKYFLKYCSTCNLIRDVRTFHCDKCGLCIEKHDHHCGYLSNCVGVYNYKKFFIFVICANIHISVVFFTCFHFIFFCKEGEYEGYEWIVFLICIVIIFAGFFEIFTVWMLIQNLISIIQNRTTREFIKKKGIWNL